MQTLSTIRSLLASHGLRPVKRFGQNFLHDHNKIREILHAAAVRADQTVLEVGPGTGVLTEPLIESGARLVAVEIDRDLCGVLRERIGPDSDRFILINGDVMTDKHTVNPLVIAALDRLAPSGSKRRPFRLLANLPYNTASPLIATLITDHPDMGDAVVTVQREVADRLLASPGGKDYGPLGILVRAMCEPRIVTTLSPGCFWPPPDVDSAVVALTRRDQPLTDDPHRLARLLRVLFTQRRKQLGSILGRGAPLPDGTHATMRPEQLTVEQLICLADAHLDR